MNLGRKTSVSVLLIAVIFTVGVLLGVALYTGVIEYSDLGSVPDEVSQPRWVAGKYWTYSFKTPEIEDVVSRLVVATQNETHYQVGVSSRIDAQRHGVLNYNPVLGRVEVENLAIYEKGVPQPLFNFPLKEGKKWTFSLLGYNDFSARVSRIRTADLPDGKTTYIADIVATTSSGMELRYSYDSKAQWINSLVLFDLEKQPQIQMNLVSFGKGFSGEVYFVRGVDLLDETFTAPDVFVQNTAVEGHPNWGPFDSLIYFFEVQTTSGSGGTLVLKDPSSSVEALRRVFGPNIFESSLGTIPSPSEELATHVSLFGEATLKLKVAGGIEYMWIV